jgi:hypothetical protein
MNPQAAIHWLEQGKGASILRSAVLVLGMLGLALWVSFKQFHGPRTEETLRQADLGRSIASGQGFSTSVNYPQVHATLEKRGRIFDAATRFPEVYQAPGYAMAIAVVLAATPDEIRQRWFDDVPDPPTGFGADYMLLALNVCLLLVAAWQAWWLGCRLFDRRVGLITGMGVMVSTSIWGHVVAVDGTSLVMVLLLGLFQSLSKADAAIDAQRSGFKWWSVAGGLVGLLFLTDYPLAVLGGTVAGYAWWRGQPRMAGLVVLLAALVALPWLWRNVTVIGSPVGLAGQGIALRSGDTTAEPSTFRTTLSADAPTLSVNKMGNKVLSKLQETLREDLWAGGGLLLTAFFVTGWIYRFKRPSTNRLRSLAALLLALMVLAQGLMNSGEGERSATAVGAPLIILFGAGFFVVLVSSNPVLKRWPSLAVGALIILQALPLIHDVMEPRRIHFSYPPYYPALFKAMDAEIARSGDVHVGWSADVPAGAAWYSGRRTWAQPETLRDFFAIHVEQRQVALVLTPETLDRPFFAELASGSSGRSRFGEWGRIYTGLITGRLPAGFPLKEQKRLADNFYVVIDGGWARAPRK